MKRIFYAPIAAAAIAVAALASAGAASASQGPQQFNTHINQNPDTTSASGGATVASPGGPVWALDNITISLIPQPDTSGDGGNVRVTEIIEGSFHGFADPVTGTALTSDGSVKGTIWYDLNAPSTTPDGSAVASTYAGGIGNASTPSLSQLATQLFPGSTLVNSPLNGNVYSFSYQNGNYTQVSDGVTYTPNGDVRGH